MQETINNEIVLLNIETSRVIKNSEVTSNILGNVLVGLAGAVGGEMPTNFNLTLTKDNLYIEAIGISAWGRLPETRYVEKIPRENIESFNVANDGSKEVIELSIMKNKITKLFNKDAVKKEVLTLTRNNQNYDNLALEMAKLINKQA